MAQPAACDELQPTIALMRALFRRLAFPLTGGALLAACQGDPSVAVLGAALGEGGVCVDGRSVLAASVHPAASVHYISDRNTFHTPRRVQVEVLSAGGIPCGEASAPELCRAEIERVSVRETVDHEGSYLLTTDGDVVTAWKTLEEKLQILGSIDTPAEAVLIAEHAGYPIDCSTTASARGDGFEVIANTFNDCDGEVSRRFTVEVDADGTVRETRSETFEGDTCAVGRRPPGLCRPSRLQLAGGSSLGRYFARAARLEAASIDAFEILERDLSQHGLPRGLRRWIRAAADDEVRHARDTAALAEAHGVRPLAPRVGRYARRSLSEVALENALEGCVSETYGAFVATVQAALAPTAELRRVLRTIADDETRHAALSWQLAAWMEPRLSPDQRRRIDRRRAAAIAALGATG